MMLGERRGKGEGFSYPQASFKANPVLLLLFGMFVKQKGVLCS
jgi:hypothetical protein